jgi:hypothetical protein
MDPGFLLIAIVFVVILVILRIYLRDAARARARRHAQLHRYDWDGADGRRVQKIRKRNGRGFD